MAKKDSSARRAQEIFDNYVAQEREKRDARGYDTTNAYDDFAKAAQIVNPDITTEELDELFFKNYSNNKYCGTARRWWEYSDKVDTIIDIMRNILDTAPTYQFMSRSDILERAGAKKRYTCTSYWEAEPLHAFELLEKANVFSKMNIMTCGKVFIHLYRMK